MAASTPSHSAAPSTGHADARAYIQKTWRENSSVRRHRCGAALVTLVTLVVLVAACSSSKPVAVSTTDANASPVRSSSTSASSAVPSRPSTTAVASTVASSAVASSAAALVVTSSQEAPGGSPTTEASAASDVSVLDPTGKVDADVVVQAFDTLKFDKGEYESKSDLTIGLFDQGSMHHTLLIEGQDNFKLEVDRQGDVAIGDVLLRRGTYTIYCELPGHRAGGMEATLLIE